MKLIPKRYKRLTEYTNTEYDTTQVLSSNLSFANLNNDSTHDSPITLRHL